MLNKLSEETPVVSISLENPILSNCHLLNEALFGIPSSKDPFLLVTTTEIHLLYFRDIFPT